MVHGTINNPYFITCLSDGSVVVISHLTRRCLVLQSYTILITVVSPDMFL